MSEAPIKILIVEDNPRDVQLMDELLSEAPGLRFDLTNAERLEDALRALDEKRFDAILLDLRLPDSEGIETFIRLHDKAPTTPTVVLTGLDDGDMAVKAVELGAQDYLVKGQVDGESLARAIRYAIARQVTTARRPRGRARVLVFVGAKGGAGTTSLVLNVAAALARQGKEVIAAEMRPCYGTFSAQLGRTSVENISHLLHLDPERIDENEIASRLLTLSFGPRVLFGPQHSDEFADIDPEHAAAITEQMARMADFVVVDLPCYPSPGARAVSEHSDFLVLVVEKEPSALSAAKVQVETLRSWGLGMDRIGVVFVSRAAYTAMMSLREMGKEIGCGIVGAVLQATEAGIDAMRSGVPLVIHDADHMASTNIVQLADRLARDRITHMDF